jgi:uncharacterized protein (TIGR00661 family)
MKILYGVVGEGMGHAIRSRAVIEQLLAWGHEVEIVVSGRAYDYLKAQFEGVNRIWGLTLVMEDHKVQPVETAIELIKGAISGAPSNARRYIEMIERFEPDAVVSDFESWSVFYGLNRRIPVICLDNIQAVRRCWHPDEVLRGHKADWRLAKSIIKAKIPTASHYLITTFFDAPVKRERTTLVPPILRDSILQATPTRGEHILVYQTGATFDELPEVLKLFPDIPFKVYGLRRDLKEPAQEDNLTFCPFSEAGFVEDLASCKGVIASAGFTLISEALHLGKPYLATPVHGQFEQLMNARYLQHLGYGLEDSALDEFGVRAFLAQLPRFEENLAGYHRKANAEVFEQLRVQLEGAVAAL